MSGFTTVRIIPNNAEAKKAIPKIRKFALEIGLKAEVNKNNKGMYLLIMGDENGVNAFLNDFVSVLDLNTNDFTVGSISSMNIDSTIVSILTTMAVFSLLPVSSAVEF